MVSKFYAYKRKLRTFLIHFVVFLSNCSSAPCYIWQNQFQFENLPSISLESVAVWWHYILIPVFWNRWDSRTSPVRIRERSSWVRDIQKPGNILLRGVKVVEWARPEFRPILVRLPRRTNNLLWLDRSRRATGQLVMARRFFLFLLLGCVGYPCENDKVAASGDDNLSFNGFA